PPFLPLRTTPLPTSTLFPYTTLFRSDPRRRAAAALDKVRIDEDARRVRRRREDLDADRARVFVHHVGGRDRVVRDRRRALIDREDRKSTRLNSSHLGISYAVFCLKKK